jgi:hypothetical protein
MNNPSGPEKREMLGQFGLATGKASVCGVARLVPATHPTILEDSCGFSPSPARKGNPI